MKDPAGAMMSGPGYGLDNYTFGTMVSNELLGMLALAAALMSIFLMIRHTRAEEETGRAELIRANLVGRRAPLTAALLTLAVANGAIIALLAAALILNGLAVPDSLAVAVGVGLVGVCFGSVAAVTAQLNEHARAASGMAGAALGLVYVFRGVGDAQRLGGTALSWLSPIGWAQQMRAFVDLRWWPLLLCAGLTAVLVAAAYLLAARRRRWPAVRARRPSGGGHCTAFPGGADLADGTRQHHCLVGWPTRVRGAHRFYGPGHCG